MTPTEVALTIPGTIASYLMLMAASWRAAPDHRLDVVRSIAEPGLSVPVIALTALCAAAFLLLRRDPHRRLYLFCAAWFLIALAPVLNLSGLSAQEFIHDRYLYLPSSGLCVMAADLALSFARRSERRAAAIWIGAGAVTIAYATMLFSVQRFWHDEIALFTHCVDEAPDTVLCHNRLGMALAGHGDLAGARREFETVRTFEPDNGWNLYDLGLVYADMGDKGAAVRAMAEGLERIEHPSPTTYVRLAFVADAASDKAASEAAFRHAAALPGGADAVALARAQLLRVHGDSKGAEQALRELLRRKPDNAEAIAALGLTLLAQRRYEEALEALRHATRIASQAPFFHYLLALTLHQMGREREARDECEVALAGAPDDPQARALMAAIEHNGAPR